MEIVLSLSIALAIASIILFIKNKSQVKQLEEFENNTNNLTTINQQHEIELAKLNERLNSLAIVESESIKLLFVKKKEDFFKIKSLIYLLSLS